MTNIKITKQRWFKPVLILVIFILLTFIISRLIILSRPESLRRYLEFLDKNTERAEDISVLTKQEFAFKYLGATENTYQPENFFQLFQSHFPETPKKENESFKIYQIPSPSDKCQIQVIGVGQKKDLVYVFFQNICLENAQKNK